MGKFYDALKKWQEQKGRPDEPGAALKGAEPRPEAPQPEVWAPLEQASLARPAAGGQYAHLLINNGADPAIIEQYKMLRTYILHYQNNLPPRTLLVTSTVQGEGKTTVAGNLAMSIASSIREHVLLMDCDLREPSLHRLFGLKPTRGLVDYLSRGTSLGDLIMRTSVNKLSFLPAGPKAPNAAELLASEGMHSLLTEVKERYDDRFIILDSTPLLPTTDPTILATQVEAVLLVVRAGMVNREIVARVVETVGREKFLGVVFNAVEPSPTSYAYKYYYKPGYRYRRD